MKIKVVTDDVDRFCVRLDRKAKDFPNDIRSAIKNSSAKIKANAINNITKNGNVKTGYLRRGIGFITTPTQGTIHTSNIKYAKGIEEGNSPHIIKPKSKKMLYWNGASHPVKMVRHPGNKAYPFLKPAFEQEKSNFVNNLKKATKLD